MNNAKKASIFGLIFVALVLIGAFTKLYILIFLGFFSLLLAWYFAYKNVNDLKQEANDHFEDVLKMNTFTADKKVFSHDNLSGLAISEEREQVAYVSRNAINQEYAIKFFNFKEIIEAKVLTQSETLTSASVGSAITRGVTGTLLAGGIGGIIGGITAKQTSTQKIKELTLEFVVDDLLNPRYTMTFYKSGISIDNNHPTIPLIEEWYRMFSVIINRNSKEVRSV